MWFKYLDGGLMCQCVMYTLNLVQTAFLFVP